MRRSPVLAAVLSFVAPGLGQLYLGERATGIAILCVDVGVAIAVAVAFHGGSWLTLCALAVAYLGIWIPAVMGAYQYSTGRPNSLLAGQQRWYVIVMLMAAGPGAIPLLWHSPRFSRTAKVSWTALVILVALSFLALILFVAPALERWLEQAPSDPLIDELRLRLRTLR